MKNTKNDQNSQKPPTMLDQEVGSMEDKKTNEDFNHGHPNHTGLTKAIQTEMKKKSTKKLKS